MYRFCFFFLYFLGYIPSCFCVYELSIAAIFRDEGRFLKEWIEYHRMVGVEHFYLYNDSSRDNYLEILNPYIEKGIVDLVDWPVPKYLDFIDFQRKAYRDALKKSAGATQWLALIDIDEYLLPSQDETVTECLANHFADASAVFINWFHFGTNLITLKEGQSMLFNLTACADSRHSQNSIGKSIVRPDRALPDELWNVHHFVLDLDAVYYNGDGEALYFVNTDLKLDGHSHYKFIRLNHYVMRDEQFFYRVKLVRTRGIGIEDRLVFQHYLEFNRERDEAIIHFILDKHLDMWKSFWKDRVQIR